jgi:hypothetical protein
MCWVCNLEAGQLANSTYNLPSLAFSSHTRHPAPLCREAGRRSAARGALVPGAQLPRALSRRQPAASSTRPSTGGAKRYEHLRAAGSPRALSRQGGVWAVRRLR